MKETQVIIQAEPTGYWTGGRVPLGIEDAWGAAVYTKKVHLRGL